MVKLYTKPVDKELNFNILNTDKFKTSEIIFNFIMPLDKNKASYNSLLPSVLKRGSRKYKSMDILQSKLDTLYGASLYGFSDKKGDNQIFGLGINFIDSIYVNNNENMVKECASILLDTIFNPLVNDDGFKEEYVEGEKIILIDNIKAQINNKRIYAMNRCVEEMCKNDVYATNEIGDIDIIKSIDEKKLYEHYCEVLKKARIEVTFVGKKESSKGLVTMIRNKFKKIDRMTEPIKVTEPLKPCNKVEQIEENLDITQGQLVIGFTTGKITRENMMAYSLFNAVYGAGTTSKLFMNVREKLSLCYYCSTRMFRLKGMMIAFAGIEFKNKDLAYNEILAQLENVKNGEFSKEELENGRKAIINSYNTLDDTGFALADFYLSGILQNDVFTPEFAIKQLKKVKKEDVINCAKSINPDTVYFLNMKAGE